MRALSSALAAIVIVALLGLAAGCAADGAPGTLVATAPDGARLAVATTGGSNVRVLYVSGGSIVRLREIFVPEGEPIEAIAWSEDGRNVIVTTRGPLFAVDTQTWRVQSGSTHAAGGTAQRTRG